MRTTKLPFFALAVASVAAQTPSQTVPAPPALTDELSPECSLEAADIFQDRPEPSGELREAVSSAALATVIAFPTNDCQLLSKLPASVRDDYAEYETRLHEWWQSERSAFSDWASTCTGTMTGDFANVVTPYLTHTGFLDTWNPGATTCATASGETAATQTGDAAASSTLKAAGSRQTALTGGCGAMAAAAAMGVGVYAPMFM